MSLKEIAMEEVAKHNKAGDCWIVIGNDKTGGPKVYDITDYLDDHPGGAEVLLDVGGQDADEFFEDIGHSKNARIELEKHLVGTVKIAEAELKRRADIVMSSTGDENPQTVAAAIINDIEEGKKEPCQPVLYRFDDFEVEVPTPLVAIPLASNQDGPKNSTNAGKIVCCCDTRVASMCWLATSIFLESAALVLSLLQGSKPNIGLSIFYLMLFSQGFVGCVKVKKEKVKVGFIGFNICWVLNLIALVILAAIWKSFLDQLYVDYNDESLNSSRTIFISVGTFIVLFYIAGAFVLGQFMKEIDAHIFAPSL